MAELQGRIALITGAGRGIGEATARLFIAEGARVGLVGRNAAQLAELAERLGPNAHALPCDVSEFGQVSAAVDRLAAVFGAPDILINNAGVIEPIAPLADTDPGAWAKSIAINLTGVYNGMRAVLPSMIAAGAGTILTVSSGAAHAPLEGWSAYCAGKAGVAMLTRSCDLENRNLGIRAIGLSPGTVRTEMQVRIRASGVNRVSQLDPAAHIPAEWPARALLWMCTPAADPHLGEEVSLRDEGLRAKLGLRA